MMQWTGADRELAHSLLLARHFQITSIEFEVFRLRSSSMLEAALQFCNFSQYLNEKKAVCKAALPEWSGWLQYQHKYGARARNIK
jgi:hypothetical protein